MKRSAPSSAPAFDLLEPRQLLAFVLWDGGGGDTNWDNPLNWSGDLLPGAADHVIIDAPGSPTITRSQGAPATIASLWALDALNISAGTLSIAGDWKQSAPLFMSGGRVAGAGNMIINGEVLWIGGEIVGGGKVLIYPGSQLTIDGDVTLGKDLYNNGSLRWASGDIVTNGGTIQNLTGRTFTILSDGTLSSSGPTTTLINYGTLTREGPGQTTINVRFSNYPSYFTLTPFPPPPPPPGIVDVRSGTLAFTGTVAEKQGDALLGAGVWMVSSTNARLLLPGPDLRTASGTYVLSGVGASFPQLEHVNYVSSLTLSGGRAFTFTNLAVQGSSVPELIIDSPGFAITLPRVSAYTLTVRGGDVTLAQGIKDASYFNVAANASLTFRGESYVSYGNISGAGLIRVAGLLRLIGGEVTGPGQLLITSTGTINNSGQYYEFGTLLLTRRTINYGTISLFQTYFGFDSLVLSTELVNRGTLDLGIHGYVETSAGTGPGSAPAYITNFGVLNTFGTLTLRGAGGGVRLTNTGTVHVLSGSFVLNGGAYGGGTWRVESGAELAFGGLGSNLNNASFFNAGRIRQAATAAWNNPFIAGPGEVVNTAPAKLTLTGAGTSIAGSSIRNDGRITIGAGSSANAQFNANFYNNAELNLGIATLTVNGDFNVGAGSRLISTGLSAFDPFRIHVTGNADLKGSLTVNFLWPAAPGFYNFITTGSHTGAFSSTVGTGLPPGTFLLFQFFGNLGKYSVATL